MTDTDTSPGRPLDLKVDTDVSGGFSKPGNFDPGLALDRAGNLSIDGEGPFTVHFIGKNFRPRPSGTIKLTQSGVFDLVQDCRDAWDKAFTALAITRPAPAGGQETYRPYEDKWDTPVDEAAFRSLAAKLAVAGSELFEALFERDRSPQLDDIMAELRALARGPSFALTVNAPSFQFHGGCFIRSWRRNTRG